MGLTDLPDNAPAYVPGVGEVTVGEIRASSEETDGGDHLSGTIKMWRYIVHDPKACPWENSGPISPASTEVAA